MLEMFYLNTIEQLFLFVEQLDQLEVCLAYIRLLAGIPILTVFQNLRWNSNKTSLCSFNIMNVMFSFTDEAFTKDTQKFNFFNNIGEDSFFYGPDLNLPRSF